MPPAKSLPPARHAAAASCREGQFTTTETALLRVGETLVLDNDLELHVREICAPLVRLDILARNSTQQARLLRQASRLVKTRQAYYCYQRGGVRAVVIFVSVGRPIDLGDGLQVLVDSIEGNRVRIRTQFQIPTSEDSAMFDVSCFAAPSTQASDHHLERRVWNFLRPRVPDLESLAIEANHGTITIHGHVADELTRLRCLECGRHVAGVRTVIDLIEVDGVHDPELRSRVDAP